jgi:hypothetical protein
MKIMVFFLLSICVYPQMMLEEELDSAFLNAKKGIYWAMSNINPVKNSLHKELIADNKLYSVVKLKKEVDGVKIESKGFHNSSEVLLKVYRSNDFLEKEGYLKKETEEAGAKKKKRL